MENNDLPIILSDYLILHLGETKKKTKPNQKTAHFLGVWHQMKVQLFIFFWGRRCIQIS